MKQLTLIRHAKSSRHEQGLRDRDRPLNKRGLRDAPRMGRKLARRQFAPDLVLSSPATRAVETARLIAHELGWSTHCLQLDERLYTFDPDALLAVIREFPDAYRHVCFFGHNPACTEVARRLAGHAEDFPTCGVAMVTLRVQSWAMVKPGDGSIEEFLYPGQLEEEAS